MGRRGFRFVGFGRLGVGGADSEGRRTDCLRGAQRGIRQMGWGWIGCRETCPLAFLGHVAGAWVACLWSRALGACCARRLHWPGSYSGDWSRKWGRIRLGGVPTCAMFLAGGVQPLSAAGRTGRRQWTSLWSGRGRLGCRETCPLVFLGHGAGAWVACLLVAVRGRLCGCGVRRRRAFPTWAVGRASGAAFGLAVPARAMFRAFGDVICSPLLSLSPRPAVDGSSANWLGVEAAAWRGGGRPRRR